MNSMTKPLKAAVSVLLLLSATACANTQPVPSMADYSYVPPTKFNAPAPNYGLEDF